MDRVTDTPPRAAGRAPTELTRQAAAWLATARAGELDATDARTAGTIAGTRVLDFLDGTAHVVDADTCRGCFMDRRPELLPSLVEPILDLGDVVVRQDAEWPVPGFYVVSLRDHVGSLADVDDRLAARYGQVLALVRRGLRDATGVWRAQCYTEERLSMPHLHTWLLPLWPGVMAASGIRPKVYESNVMAYLGRFRIGATRGAIEACNAALRDWLDANGAGLRVAR